MGRKQRRHPDLTDPVAAAQEETNWSGFTYHVRALSQGKLLFPRVGARRITDRSTAKNVLIFCLLASLAITAVLGLLMLVARIL